MSKRLVSFLGLGNTRPEAKPPYYSPGVYRLDEKESRKTPLVVQALCDIIPDVTSIIVLGTADVERRWFGADELFRQYFEGNVTFVRLPMGATTAERWELFEKVSGVLTEKPLEKAGEETGPGQIIVDITHGFRAQPVLGMAALTYVISDWSRNKIESPPRLRVLYGAWEARDENDVTPVWDLTELVTAALWNSAIDSFVRHGRADDMAKLAQVFAKESVSEAQERGVKGPELSWFHYPRKLGEAAKEFADSLVTSRLRDIITKCAPRLVKELEGEAAAPFVDMLPVLREPLRTMKEKIVPLCAKTTFGQDGILASLRLARLLGELQRYSEQASLLREVAITLHGVLAGKDPCSEPGPGFSGKQREELTEDWKSLSRGEHSVAGGSTSQRFASWSAEVADLRNDVNHCGIRQNPRASAVIRRQLAEYTGELERIMNEILEGQG